jgi:hypothetical protein
MAEPIPNWSQPALEETTKYHFNREIWRWLTSVAEAAFGSVEPAAAEDVDVGTSPFEYTALSTGNLLIEGGTVTGITITRMGSTYVVPATAAFVPVCPDDVVEVTYAVLPTLTFLPSW